MTLRKLVASALLMGLLSVVGAGLAYRTVAADGPGRRMIAAVAKDPGRRAEVIRPASDPTPIALAEAEAPADEPISSYPFNTDPANVYELPALAVDYGDLHLKAGPVSVVPILTERGITGAMLIGDGTFRFAPRADRVIEGTFRAAMLRFNPGEQPTILPLGKGKRVIDRGTWEMSRHLLREVIVHCWQSNRDHGRIQEVLIPPKGAFAVDLYSRQHGDLLISVDPQSSIAFSFTQRKALYEQK